MELQMASVTSELLIFYALVSGWVIKLVTDKVHVISIRFQQELDCIGTF